MEERQPRENEGTVRKIRTRISRFFNSALIATIAGSLVLSGLLWLYRGFSQPPAVTTVTSPMNEEATAAQKHDISAVGRLYTYDAVATDLRYTLTMVPASAARPARMPFAVYTDGGAPGNHYVPSGYMGDYSAVTMNQYWARHPHDGKTCIQVTYRGALLPGVGWAGVYWQSPVDDWGTVRGRTGYDLRRARRLTFWVRGTTGAEFVQFLVGGITGRYGDSLRPAVKTQVLQLSTAWQQVTINLAGKNLTHIIGGFGWVASAQDNPNGAVFYLDDIVYSA